MTEQLQTYTSLVAYEFLLYQSLNQKILMPTLYP